MYKTIWIIHDEKDNETIRTKLTYYHFGKEACFPSWYCKEGHIYVIEMLWNLKLTNTVSIFFKCLRHHYIVQ